MGLFFTILYILVAYFTPTVVFGEMGEYHLETIIVALALIFSAAQWSRAGLTEMPQTWAIAGLCFVIFCSSVFIGLKGDALTAVINVLPALSSFFLVVLNCRSRMRLQILVACIFGFSTFVIYQGYTALQANAGESPYLMDQGNGTVQLFRIRGLGFFSDPNDLGQLLVGLIPCMFFFLRKGQAARNLLAVYLPVALLLYGMFLTHSRGGMLALLVIAIVAGRRKIGLIPGIVGGGLGFIALTALGFTGGREVSASAGEDRISLWSQGLEIVRSHPLFGVGINRFPEYTDVGLTAHNTFVVCVGELGLIGVFCWLLMVVTTIRNALTLSTVTGSDHPPETLLLDGAPFPASVAAGAMATPTPAVLPQNALVRTGSAFRTDPAHVERQGLSAAPISIGALRDSGADTEAENKEIRRMAFLTVLSFAGFLTAGWFLSRSYTISLFVNLGMAAAIFQMAVERGIAPPQMPRGRMLKVTAITLAALLVLVYVIIQFDHFMPK